MTPLEVYQSYKTQNVETRTILLTAPILHIGSQFPSLNPFEYVQSSGNVYFPDANALSSALLKKGGSFFNDYIGTIENNQDIETLLRDAFGSDWAKKTTASGAKLFPYSAPLWTQNGYKINNLRPMIRNGMGELYIPGTSIKGAIRTAIAYYLLKNQPPQSHRVSAIEEKLRELMGEPGKFKGRAKKADDALFMDEIFSNFFLNYQGKDLYSNCRVSNPNKDFLRALQISDSLALTSKKSKVKGSDELNKNVVAEVIVSSHFQDWRAKSRAPIYVEMVHDVQTEFTITIDKDMLSWFRHQNAMDLPFSSIDELLAICKDFAQAQWLKEVSYWENIENNRDKGKNLDFDLIWDNYYGKKTCPYSLRMGWGSGLMGTTVDCLFQDEIVSNIRDICGREAPGFEAPKSRRTIVNDEGQIRFVPGWVNLKIK